MVNEANKEDGLDENVVQFNLSLPGSKKSRKIVKAARPVATATDLNVETRPIKGEQEEDKDERIASPSWGTPEVGTEFTKSLQHDQSVTRRAIRDSKAQQHRTGKPEEQHKANYFNPMSKYLFDSRSKHKRLSGRRSFEPTEPEEKRPRHDQRGEEPPSTSSSSSSSRWFMTTAAAVGAAAFAILVAIVVGWKRNITK